MKQYYKHFVKFIFALCFVLFLIGNANAQKEANIWYFGNRAGIDFNGAVPVALTDGEMNTWEGCASIADANGNLLFYTDGVSVWNKNHLKMPNGTGLMGHSSSTQSGVIVPQPGNDSIYYVFTIAVQSESNGFRYSKVNMKLSGGLGDVEASTKNTPILTPVTEKITATRHANGKDIWVITHGWNNNNFYAYLLTEKGFVTIPVVSSTGLYHEGIVQNTIGQLKVSNDGSKLALCIIYSGKSQLFDFNISTGIVSNPITFLSHQSYGCEFSPDRSKLYIGGEYPSSIYQYDISSNDSATIVNTRVLITPISNTRFGSLQLAPDGKIYVAIRDQVYLNVIEKPNKTGLACEFKLNGFNLSGGISLYGLPNFIGNYMYKTEFEANSFCFNDETCFKYTGLGNFDSLVWDFDDGSDLKTTNEKNICHQYADTGTYDVKLVKWYLGKPDTTVRIIIINPQKYSSLSVAICEGDSIFLQGEYRKETGVYFDTIFNGSSNGCDSVIETSLMVFPKVTNLVDIFLCPDDSVLLEGRFQTAEGVYYDTIFNGSSNGCDSVIITNLFQKKPTFNVQSFHECEGFSIAVGSNTYSTSGIYKDIVNGCDTIITQLNIYDTPDFSFIQVEDTCNEGKGSVVGKVISGKSPFAYSWNTGSTDSVIYNLKSGTYSLTVIDSNGCLSADTTEVGNINVGCNLLLFVPNAFSPNGDGSNDVFKVSNQHLSKINVQIFNRWGEEIFRSTDVNFAWDGTYKGHFCPDGIYTVIIHYETHLESGKKYLYKGNLHLLR
jgi:gliding motility-associated-like protein